VTFFQMLQISGALTMVAALLPPRVPALRPYARRIGLVAVGLYVAFAVVVIIARIVLGPEPFMG
jgi:hypothetical protein